MSSVDSEEDLIAHVVEAAANMGQQSGIFECTDKCLCCVVVDCVSGLVALIWYEVQLFFSPEYFSGFA
jgi:hypothetical protein